MSRTPDELLEEALKLPAKGRAALAEALLSSLDQTQDAEPAALAQEWLAEVTRRAAEIDSGAVQTIPAAEVFRAAREELLKLRQRTKL
jgi:putative addiction module component (TIGR02574 family)